MRTTKSSLFVVVFLFLCVSSLLADEFDALPNSSPVLENESEGGSDVELSFDKGRSRGEFDASSKEVAFDEETEFETDSDNEEEESTLADLFSSSRFTLKYEVSYKTEEETGIKMNRGSFRFEYSRFFLEHFFLRFDSKINVFLSNDHRARAENKETLVEPYTKEAFLQTSFGNTSIKGGVQVMIWGESDGGAITDVISPRDYSELFFISLEESRIGQPMLILDQFSSFGDWSLFYIPEPKFNEYPKENTAYYHDPFNKQVVYQDATSDDPVHEYGIRWKKTFGKSDISLMVASLMDNDYAYQLSGFTPTGKTLITKTKQRFTMIGMTFNYARGNVLYKGEIGRKTPRSFNDASYQIIKRNVVDTALAVEYSPGGAYTLGMEAVNSHIQDWNNESRGVHEDSGSIVIAWRKSFLNEDLSISWMSSYTDPETSFIHSLSTSYKWNDNVTIDFEGYYPDIRDEASDYFFYRDQKHLVLKIQTQF